MKKINKQMLYRADIETLSHDGRGIARIEGKTTFIAGALPGETVDFKYTRSKSDFDEGRAESVITSSPLRVEPGCRHFEVCGGCSLQHLDEKEQINLKQDLLLNALQRIGHVTPGHMLEPLSAESWNYRHKARLSVNYIAKKNATLVGFRERNNPRFIADIQECPVIHSKVHTNLAAIRDFMDTLSTRESIAQIEVAAGDYEVALILRHLTELPEEDTAKLRTFAARHGFTVFLQPGGHETVTLFYPEDGNGMLEYGLPAQALRFQFHPMDFTQINPALNRLMVTRALELMDIHEEDIILDLFCGLGNFSLALARKCSKVMGVEGSEAMVKRAKSNADLNQLHNTEFYACNLDQPAVLELFKNKRINKILIDPPRTGALEIVRQIDTLNPEKIVYVSCNPATLARDSGILVNEKGYRLRAAGVMDMFPHTAHVESIALFEKG